VQRRKRTRRSNFEDRAITVRATCRGCPVKVPVAGLNEGRIRAKAVCPMEGVKDRQRTRWCDLEDGVICCPVKVPIAGLNQTTCGRRAVSFRASEAVQRRKRTIGGDFEDRAKATPTAPRSCPLEVPIRGLNQTSSSSPWCNRIFLNEPESRREFDAHNRAWTRS
jgi:hypothetical protein